MTIGFDASRAFIENRTGTENYSFQLLKSLSRIDQKNTYLIYLRPGQNPGKDWPENFKFKVINFPRLWTQLGLALRTFIDPLDVLFIPAHTLPLIRNPFLETVITVHDLGAEYLPAFHQLKQVLYLKLMTHYQLRSASKIIAVSEATKKDIVKRVGIKSGKIEVVYEGVGEEFRVQNSEFRIDTQNNILNGFGLEKGKYFLFVGTIQPRKNLGRLIKAFSVFRSRLSDQSQSVVGSSVSETGKQKTEKPKSENREQRTDNRNFKLILVGNKGWKSDEIYSLPKELEIEKQVRFLGRISDEELRVLYGSAAALTYPSLFEGFGLPILEAFACGCPVITSNTSSMPEVAGNGAMLVDALNEAEITEAMVKITKNDILRNSLVVKGYSRLKNFSWEKSAQNTLEVLESVREN